jgi:hypothetical protein
MVARRTVITCDVCHLELDRSWFKWIEVVYPPADLKKWVLKPPDSDNIDICRHCQIDAVIALDDRPKGKAS